MLAHESGIGPTSRALTRPSGRCRREYLGRGTANDPTGGTPAGMARTYRCRPCATVGRNHEIADLLVIADSTAKTHVKRILAKIGARDRAQAVVFAYQAGLVTPRAAR